MWSKDTVFLVQVNVWVLDNALSCSLRTISSFMSMRIRKTCCFRNFIKLNSAIWPRRSRTSRWLTHLSARRIRQSSKGFLLRCLHRFLWKSGQCSKVLDLLLTPFLLFRSWLLSFEWWVCFFFGWRCCDSQSPVLPSHLPYRTQQRNILIPIFPTATLPLLSPLLS